MENKPTFGLNSITFLVSPYLPENTVMVSPTMLEKLKAAAALAEGDKNS